MAIVETTLASACAISDTVIVLAASTSVTAGYKIVIDQEVMQVVNSYTIAGNGVNVPVLRGLDGTVNQAHASGANVYHAANSDTGWGSPAPQTDTALPIAGRANTLVSYSAAGAIAHPKAGNNGIAIINGTNGLAMTLADPGKALDGCILYIQGNGAAAHTVTIAGGVGGGGSSYDVFTFAAGAKNGIALMAVNETWNILSSVLAGNTTNITATIA